MSAFESVPVEKFPMFLANFAAIQGGDGYISEAMDGIELRRGAVSNGGAVRSFVSFSVERLRSGPDNEVSNIDYTLEHGVTTKLDVFPDVVHEELEAIEEEYDPMDGIWHESLQTLLFSTRTHEGGTICVCNNYRYGVSNHTLLEVPVIGGEPVFVEPEDMNPPAEMARTAEYGGIYVLEYVQDGNTAAMTTEVADPFEAIIQSMVGETNIVQNYINQMAGMIAMFQPSAKS